MIKLKDYDLRLLERVSNKMNLDLNIKEIDNEFYIKQDDLLSAIDELYDSVGFLEEKIEDLEQDIQENYEPKKFNPYKEYGISKSEFE